MPLQVCRWRARCAHPLCQAGVCMAPALQAPQKGYFITHRLTMARLFRHRNLAGGGHRFAQGWKENNWPNPDFKEHFGPNTDWVELS